MFVSVLDSRMEFPKCVSTRGDNRTIYIAYQGGGECSAVLVNIVFTPNYTTQVSSIFVRYVVHLAFPMQSRVRVDLNLCKPAIITSPTDRDPPETGRKAGETGQSHAAKTRRAVIDLEWTRPRTENRRPGERAAQAQIKVLGNPTTFPAQRPPYSDVADCVWVLVDKSPSMAADERLLPAAINTALVFISTLLYDTMQ